MNIRCCCQFSCLCRNKFYFHYSSAWNWQLLSSMLWSSHQIIRVLEESKCHNSLSFSHVVMLSSSFLWTCERCTVVFKASFAETLKFTFKAVWCSLEHLQCAYFSCKIFKRRWYWNRLIASSQVLEFESSTRLEKCRVELKFFWKSVESSWEVELKNSSWIEKLDSTIWLDNSTWLDKILNRCK